VTKVRFPASISVCKPPVAEETERPQAFARLKGRLRVADHLAQRIVAHLIGKSLYVIEIPDVHDLGDHAIWSGDGLLRRLPPDLLAGVRFQHIRVDLAHAQLPLTPPDA
jgi:hypothetical protein